VNFWILIQIIVDLVILGGLGATWIRLTRPAKDDPRLSRGLQLLQSKIAILEDLSEKTEEQFQNMTALVEHKMKALQGKIQSSDRQIQLIDHSMQKSLDVAKIFEDRIPHAEILERQNTIKYVKAAKMAHQGASVADIAQQVDLSMGEIELISKVNKNQLMFCEESLPEWAKDEAVNPLSSPSMGGLEFSETPNPAVTPNSFAHLSEAFAQMQSPTPTTSASPQASVQASVRGPLLPADPSAPAVSGPEAEAALTPVATPGQAPVDPQALLKKQMAEMLIEASAKATKTRPTVSRSAPREPAAGPVVRPVEFRRIDVSKNLG
jgi:hypothetical protein